MTILKTIKKKFFEQDEYSKFLIQLAYKCSDLNDPIKIIINCNEELSSDLT